MTAKKKSTQGPLYTATLTILLPAPFHKTKTKQLGSLCSSLPYPLLLSKTHSLPSRGGEDPHFSSTVLLGKCTSLYKPSVSFYICLCTQVCRTASLSSADMSPVHSWASAFLSSTIIQGKSLTSSLFFNTICFCVWEHLNSKGGYWGHQSFTDAFCQVPGSLYNKLRSRLRHFDCSIHHGTKRTHEVGWWRKCQGDREEILLKMSSRASYFFYVYCTRLGLENGSIFQEVMQQFYIEFQGKVQSMFSAACQLCSGENSTFPGWLRYFSTNSCQKDSMISPLQYD